MSTFAYLQAAQVLPAVPPDGKAQKITGTVPLTASAAETVARALLAEIGLRADAQLAGFNRQAGYDLLRHAATQLQRQRVFTSQVEAARRARRRELRITVAIAKGIINDVRRYLALPLLAENGRPAPTGARPSATGASQQPGPPAKPVDMMSNAEKIGEAIRRSIPMLPADALRRLSRALGRSSNTGGGRRVWQVLSNAGSRGLNVVTIDDVTGEVLHKAFWPR